MSDDLRRPEPTSPPTRRDVIRTSIARRLPEESARRVAARRALDVFRTVRSHLPARFGGTRRAAERRLPYERWLESHEVSPAPTSSRPAGLGTLWVVVVRDPADAPDAVTATESSATLQVEASVRVVVVSTAGDPDVALDAAFGARGEEDFVVVVRAGDRLDPGTARAVLDAWWADPAIELVTWDDDVRRRDPRFRGGWAPDTLLSTADLGRSFALRADALGAAGGFDPTAGEVAWWDLLLRSELDERRVAHVPRVLTHLDRRPPLAPAGGETAVQRWLTAHDWPARAVHRGDHVALEWAVPSPPTVSIVIPSRSNHEMLERLLPTLEATTYPLLEVLIVDNSGRTAEKERWYDTHRGTLDLRVMWWDEHPFNFSAVNNAGAAATTGEVLVFLNDDTEAIVPTWLDDMVGWVTRPGIGVVGAVLLFDDGTIQHAGVRMGHHGLADHYFLRLTPGTPTYAGPAGATRTVDVVTGACAAIRRQVFDAIGGFDDRLVLTGNDVELCLDTRRAGLRNVVSSGALLHHHESVTRGKANAWDDTFRSYWRFRHWVVAGDDYFSPNLRVLGPTPDVVHPEDPTSIELLSSHLRRTLDPRRDDDLPSDATTRSWTEPGSVVAGSITAPGGGISHVVWVASHLADPEHPALATALRAAALLDSLGVRSTFAVLAEPDALWFDAVVNGASRGAVRHEVVTLGTAVPIRLPDGDVVVAVDDHVLGVVERDGRRALRVRVGDTARPSSLDVITDSERTAARHEAATGNGAVAVPPRPARTIWLAPADPPPTGRAVETLVVDVDPSCNETVWGWVTATVGRAKGERGASIRIVVVGDLIGRHITSTLGDATMIPAPDRRGLRRIAASGDRVVVVTQRGCEGRRTVDWRATGATVSVADPTTAGDGIIGAGAEVVTHEPPDPDRIADRLLALMSARRPNPT